MLILNGAPRAEDQSVAHSVKKVGQDCFRLQSIVPLGNDKQLLQVLSWCYINLKFIATYIQGMYDKEFVTTCKI